MVEYKKYKTKAGKVKWEYYEYLGVDPKTGTKKRLRKKDFDSRGEAKVHFERAMTEYLKRTSPSNKRRLRFKDLYEDYLPFYRNTGVTGGTVGKFKLEVEKHILPVIGNYYVDQISVSDCQHLVNFVKGRRKDYRKIIGHARGIFNYGVQEGFVVENPINKVIITKSKTKYTPKRISAEKNVYTTEQMMDFLWYLEHHAPFHHFVYFRILAFTGLRRGEALALRKSDINHNEKSITVSRTLSEDEDGNTIISEYTKSGNADEGAETILYLDDDTYDAVNTICKQTVFLASRERYVEILDATYVFVSPRTGSHYHRAAPNDWLKDLWKKDGDKLEQLGLHYISPHGFRHSQASMLFELDVNPKDAQHRLRHKNFKTTMDIYTHLSEKQKRTTVDKLNSLKSPVPRLVPRFDEKAKSRS